MLNRQPGWRPVIYLTAGYLDRHMDSCRAEGITVLMPAGEPTSAPKAPARKTGDEDAAGGSVRERLRSIAILRAIVGKYRDIPSPAAVARNLRAIRAAERTIRSLIREHGIDVTLLAETSAVHGAEGYVAGSHSEGVPVVTAPIEKQMGRHEAENYLYDRSMSVQRPINGLLAKMFPSWLLVHKGVGMVRAAPELIIAQELAGLAPPDPWRVVGNGEDILAVDSVSTLEHYAAEGVPAETMAVVGHAEHDMMADVIPRTAEKRAELYERLGLPPGRPLLLSPLVPDHYVSGRPECDFQDYDELVKFWVRSLAAVGTHNVVLSLHPGHTYGRSAGEWNFLEELGVKIARDDLPLLVPLCDIYVATGYSTTTQWAIACGKPVVNYDVYRYAMPVYDSTPGVLTVTEQSEFTDALRRLSTDRDFHAKVAADQARDAADWGILDGKAGSRLTAVFDKLISRKQSNEPGVSGK